MKLSLTDDQIRKIVELKDVGHHSWPYIGEQMGIGGEDARRTYRQYKGRAHVSYANDLENENTTFDQSDDFINIVCSSKRMMSQEDIIEQFNIDLNEWEIDRYIIKTSEGYRKDRKVDWHVKDGIVGQGDVTDTGKMLVVPLFHIQVRLIKKKKEIQIRSSIQMMIEDAKKFAPVYQKINYPQHTEGLLYELDMFDIHFGRLTWEEESGESYDIKIAEKAIKSTIEKLLMYVQNFPIEKIIFPLGNDFFNVDNKFNTTTKGTPQQEDTRYQKTFRKGREICTWMIDLCSQIAPVDVLIIPGNHDEQRSFYLGDALECWYHDSQDVNIDNRAMKQKYYSFGKNLIGFAHGADEKLKNLPFLMAVDQPQLWAKSKFREWHTGDKHHKKDLVPIADESTGMVVRILRALAAEDAWTFNSGYRSLRSSEAFLWHPENGLIAQYTATPNM